MASSADYQKQLAAQGAMPDYKKDLAKLYDNPVLKPLTNEAAQLSGQYLTSIFDPFTKMGAGAADMSPAAKLAAIGGSVGRLGGKIQANNSIQNFYGAQIDNLANTQAQKWQARQQQLKDLYQMAFQREEAERAERARQASMARQSQQMQAASLPSWEQLARQLGISTGTPQPQQKAPAPLNQRAYGGIAGKLF